MSSVPEITPEKRNIRLPEELRRLEGFLVWRYEQHGQEAKARKVPYYVSGNPRSGKQGSPQDRAKLVPFTAALRRQMDRNFDGIGLAMLADWGLTAIDIDNCVADDGSLPEIVHKLAARTYVEFSPSGKGVRAFLRGNLGNHKSPTLPGQYGLETFYSSGYVTLTGKVLPICELLGTDDKIADIDDYIVAICEERFGSSTRGEIDPDDPFIGLEPRHGMSVAEIEALISKLDPDVGRDEWVRIGMAIHHETYGSMDGFYAWNEWSSGGSKYVSEDDLRSQWDSFERRAGDRRPNVTMASVKKMVKDLYPDAESLAKVVEGVEVTTSPSVATPADYGGKFKVYSSREMTEQPPMRWLIKGILPQADIVTLVGPPGSGKSFLLFDMLAAIARGIDWCGRTSKKMRVIIVAAEGAGGYGGRIKAYCEMHNLSPDDLDIGIITARPNIMDAEEVAELAKAVTAAGGCDVLAMDTLAQVTPGANENSGEDMGRAIANARTLGEAVKAMVLFAHHTGKDLSKGARGWSGLNAAVDAELMCWRDEDGNYRELRITKQKDGEDGLRFGFQLKTVDLGADEDGETITSCVVEFTEVKKEMQPAGQISRRITRRGRWQRHTLEILETVTPGTPSMPMQSFLAMLEGAVPMDDPSVDRSRLRGTLVRAIKDLSKEREPALSVEGNVVVFLN